MPTPDDDLIIPAGLAEGTVILTSFSTRANTVISDSPLHVMLNGPIFISSPTGSSSFTNLRIDGGGQLTPYHDTTLRGDCYLSRGFMTTEFSDPDSYTLTNEGTFTIEGQDPNPFALTGLAMKRILNAGTILCSGPVSTAQDTRVENHGVWEFRGANSSVAFRDCIFVNEKNAILRVNGDTQDSIFRLNAQLINGGHRRSSPSGGRIELVKGILVLSNKENTLSGDDVVMSPGSTLAMGEGAPDWGIPGGEWDFRHGTLGPESGLARLEVQVEAKLNILGHQNKARTLRNLTLVNHGEIFQRQNGYDSEIDGTGTTELNLSGTTIENELTGTITIQTGLTTDGSIRNRGQFKVQAGGVLRLSENQTITNFEGASFIAWARIDGTGTGSARSKIHNEGDLDIGRTVRRCIIENYKTAKLAGTEIDLIDSIFVNQTGGTCTLDGAVRGGGFILNNGGILQDDLNRGMSFNCPFSFQAGTVNIKEFMTLRFSSNSVGSGTFNVSNGASLALLGGEHLFDGEYLVQGEGRLRLGTRVTGPGGRTNLQIAGGTFTIDLPKNDIRDGLLNPGPGLRIERDVTLRIARGANLALPSVSVLLNEGEFHLGGTLDLPAAATFVNGAQFGQGYRTARLHLSASPGQPQRFTHRFEAGSGSEVIATEGAGVFASPQNNVVLDDDIIAGGWIVEDGATLDIEGLTLDDLLRGASITLKGTGRFLPLDRSNHFEQYGLVRLEKNAHYEFNGFWECNGILDVKKGSSLTVSDQFETNDTATVYLDGALTTPDFDNDGGKFRGTGTINTENFNNHGELSPGASPGVLTVNGNFNQTLPGTLTIELNGPEAITDHDQLLVTGTASLGGTLQICLHPSYRPAPGTRFTILKANALSGSFDEVILTGTGQRLSFAVETVGSEVVLTTTNANYPSYEAWKSARFGSVDASDPQISGAEADPEGDRIANLFEYVTALAPEKKDAGPVSFELEPGSENALLTLPWADDVTGVMLSIEKYSAGRYETVEVEELPRTPHSPGVQLRRFRLPETGVLYRVRLSLDG